MDATREVVALNPAKKSKKRNSREFSDATSEDGNLRVRDDGNKKKGARFSGDNTAPKAVADVDSSVDIGNNSNKKKKDRSRKEKKEKDRSGKEKTEKDVHRIDVKDQGSEEKAGEQGQVKKINKEVKLKEPDYAVENDSVGHEYDGSVEIQADNEVSENVEPLPDKKNKKKKREDDVGAVILRNSGVHSTSHEEDRGGSGSKTEKCGSSNSVGNDCNRAAVDTDYTEDEIENEVTKKVRSKEDKKTKKKKKYKGAGSSLSNEENSTGGFSKRKKENSNGSNIEKDANACSSKTKKRKRGSNTSEKSTSCKKSKKVSFSDQDEVFSLPHSSSKEDRHTSADGLVRGKRFSKEEDELIKEAVLKYIEEHQLGEMGIEMVMKCKKQPAVKDCWKKIGESLPWRPYVAVYCRAHVLFERGESRKWSAEEMELVRKFHEKHGANWRKLADELGKHRFHVKDAWRRIKLPNRKKGYWSQDEYQSLFDLVNLDLSVKAFEEKKSKHGMLRDNIAWEAISEKLSTRSTPNCCIKWYNQLTSPLVAEGKWADADDYRLMIALVELDAPSEEEVDWDNLLEHRSGEICRKRWRQMVRHIGEHGVKQFNEQVDILSKRYCADLLEAREAYENKPYVD